MKKINYFFWYFPLLFFVFLAIFITVKFIFIFFFRAAFEPEFMFDLTPYYLLKGVDNLHLAVLSLIVLWISVYLHINVNKRNLLFSFIPAGIMLAGLGVEIALNEIVVSNVLHYLVFGCLLVIALIDHKHFLMFPEDLFIPEKEPLAIRAPIGKPAIAKTEPEPTMMSEVGKPLRIEGIDELLTLQKETLSDLKELINDDIQRAEVMMEKLEKKTERIDNLGKEIEERRKILIEQERSFRRHVISSLDSDSKVKPVSNEGLIFEFDKKKEPEDQSTFLDEIADCAAIVQRGILKQVNDPFIKLLGYDIKDIKDKSLLDIVAPDGLSGIQDYYLNKFKGDVISSFDTIFLTKDNAKLALEAKIKPIKFKGEKAEIIVFNIKRKEN